MRFVYEVGTGPHPHPATHAAYPRWVAGWGSGLVPFSDKD